MESHKFRKTYDESLARSKASKSDDGNFYYWLIVPFHKGNIKEKAKEIKVNVIEC